LLDSINEVKHDQNYMKYGLYLEHLARNEGWHEIINSILPIEKSKALQNILKVKIKLFANNKHFKFII